MVVGSSAMNATTQVLLQKDKGDALSKRGKDTDAISEVQPKGHSARPPLGKVTMLKSGVIDTRNHNEQNSLEQIEEYDNFDKNSYFASSFDDHDRMIEFDSQKEKMQSSLGGWYQPGAEN